MTAPDDLWRHQEEPPAVNLDAVSLDEWVNDPSRSEHRVYESNLDHWCSMCGDHAAHKIGEEGPTKVPWNVTDAMVMAGHNMTNWLCCLHFRVVIGDCGDRRTGDDSIKAERQ